MNYTRIATCALALILLLCLTVATVYSAGGVIQGRILDPKGAAIVGASVTVTNSATSQETKTTTDAEGRYTVEGLLPGIYAVVASAKGFNDAQRDNVKVDEGSAVPVDLRLEIAPVEAEVKISGAAHKPNVDPVYQQLRRQDVSGAYATVSNLQLKRQGAGFTFSSGQIYFLAPVEGRVTGAVFLGEGEMELVPPIEVERNSLKIFTNEPSIKERFSNMVLRFTDQTFEEIKASPNVTMGNDGPQRSTAHNLLRDNQNLTQKRLRDNRELRILADLYTPSRPGFFNAFIDGQRFNKLVFVYDPDAIPEISPEEVALFSYGETDGGLWTAFHRPQEYANGTASSAEDHRVIDITHHEIDGTIKGSQLLATDRVTFRVLVPGTRVVPMSLYRSLRVSHVRDEQAKELDFIQEGKDEDSDFGVIVPQPLEAGKTYKWSIEYGGGDAIRDSGGGNYILIPRSTWYPANANTLFSEDRAIFDMTFHYPKSYTFVATGAPVGPETKDGEYNVAKWSSGTTELGVAGFNYGRFKKKEVLDKDTGYNIEFFGNQELPDEIRTLPTFGAISTTAMANNVLADAQNSTRIYNLYFGKLPYTRVAMTQQPAGFFGQAWPTLIYMPYFAFMDTTQRYMLFGVRGATDNFWRYVAPHEIAHQWWGHIIGWDSYHDQWMSEGFAEFSSSLYVQMIRGNEKFLEFWEDQRKLIVEARPATKDRKPYTVGPVTQGYRLNSGKTGGVARFLIYPKGAYILHMLRMMMSDPATGDQRFQTMMKDFVQTYYNQPVSTEDFKGIVEKHITKEMNLTRNGKMDWFFNEWVYGTEVPSYKFDYTISPEGTLSGRITQSGVSDQFGMVVPVYVDYGKGWLRLGTAVLVGNSSFELKNIKLPSVPKRAAICAMNDILATSIQNK
ncbi:MAG TPA: carboxypeptidase regulatory-like domain-containing protein [Pyrinomonadaceae bacterium]|jgi:hypothetical protein|nr:carboxypeptidase regulatory-like domain-containing protein [Pyrinomonadaceae bacterium]